MVSTVGAEGAQRGGHQLGVARAQRRPHRAGAVGERGQHERAVGERLRPGQRDRRDRTGRRAAGAVRQRRGSAAAVRASRSWRRSLGLGLGLAAQVLASRLRAAPTACCVRQATPGRPSVSTAASTSPPSIETFLKKWVICSACGVLVRLLPEPVTGHRGGHERPGEHQRGQPREATGGQRQPADDLDGAVDPHQLLVVWGTGSLSASLSARSESCPADRCAFRTCWSGAAQGAGHLPTRRPMA